MKNYLYIDETGSFETKSQNKELIIGGFYTPVSPEDMVKEYEVFLHSIQEKNPDIHMVELRQKRDYQKLEQVRKGIVDLLHKLNARIVHIKWKDAPTEYPEVLNDKLSTNRYYHMLRMLLRGVILYPSIGTLRKAGEIVPTIAQRSIPVKKGQKVLERTFEVGKEKQTLATIMSSNHQAHLFRGFERTFLPCSQRIVSSAIRQPKLQSWKSNNQDRNYGLFISDIVCDLLREYYRGNVIAGIESLLDITIEYGEEWCAFEEDIRNAHLSQDIFSRFCQRAIQGQAVIDTACDHHIQYLLSIHENRRFALNVVKKELAQKKASYPLCTYIFSHLPPENTLEELHYRLAYKNHSGQASNTFFDDVNPETFLQQVHDKLSKDLVSFVKFAEYYAYIAVTYQDIFDWETSIQIVEQKFLPIANSILQEGMKWTIYGRCLSNLAQSIAMRNEDDDLLRAKKLMHDALPHFDEALDFAQWGCHMASIAALLGDEEGFHQALDVLFQSTDILSILDGLRDASELHFGQRFALAALLRASIHKKLPQKILIDEWMNQDQNWSQLCIRIQSGGTSHPTERLIRYMGELAPPKIFHEIESHLQNGTIPQVFPNTMIQHVSNVATYAAWSLRGLSLQQEELFQFWAKKAFAECSYFQNSSMAVYNDMILDTDSQVGVFYPVWKKLHDENQNAEIQFETVHQLLSLFRNECR